MALNITKASDPITVERVIALVYGQPGVGKTSLASTAEKPLLLDFDQGAHRSAFRPDTVRIEKWAEAASLRAEDLTGYKTLIVDTAGRALDYLVASMPASEGKTQLKRASGDPTLQGYGAMKASFTGWLKRITTLGLDVILIAHDKEDKDGDSRIIRPDITGGSYAEIVKIADFVGYCWMDNGQRTIDFNPSSEFIGKNSAGLPRMAVPSFINEPDWFAKTLKAMKASLGGIADAQREAVDKLSEIKEQLMVCSDAEDFQKMRVPISEIEDKTLQAQAWRMTVQFAEKSGFGWNKTAKQFTKTEQEREAA